MWKQDSVVDLNFNSELPRDRSKRSNRNENRGVMSISHEPEEMDASNLSKAKCYMIQVASLFSPDPMATLQQTAFSAPK